MGIREIRRVLYELDSDRLWPTLDAAVEWKLFDPDSPDSGYVVITKTVEGDTSFSFFPDVPELDGKFFVDNDVVIVISLMTIKAIVLEYVQEG